MGLRVRTVGHRVSRLEQFITSVMKRGNPPFRWRVHSARGDVFRKAWLLNGRELRFRLGRQQLSNWSKDFGLEH